MTSELKPSLVRQAASLVIVVEDDELSRTVLETLLHASGYAALAVPSAEEALKVITQRTDAPVVLVDLDLPGMSGAELIRILNRTRPRIQAICLSASSGERMAAVLDVRTRRMRKPVSFPKLLAAIDELAA